MGNNCTLTINKLHEAAIIAWKDLQSADYTFSTPFQLKLADGNFLQVEKMVRIIPKRRMVVFGWWKDKMVAAKLFYDPKRARLHMDKDLAGIEALRENKIPTPSLYYVGTGADKRICVLLLEQIVEAKNLEELWQEKTSIQEVLRPLQAVIIELATQHVLGVLQKDLHLKNFLLTEKMIYTLDGAQVELFPHLMPKKSSMSSLALFLSQFGIGMEELQEKLFRTYAKARGWLLKIDDISEIFLLIKQWNDQRWQRYEKKIFRECTDFVFLKDWRYISVYDRNYTSPALKHLLQHPETAFHHKTMVMLKDGRSSTVVKIELDGREFVVKRYNMKNLMHKMRRCLRPTRAAMCWRLAQKLFLFRIPTAKPVGFIENRFLGLRGKSYYIMEYVSGEHVGDYLLKHEQEPEKVATMAQRVTELLKNLAKLEITHGDLKITNILVDHHEHPVLIDLDGAAEHFSLSSLRGAWRREIKRFLQNFEHQPILRDLFKKLLG